MADWAPIITSPEDPPEPGSGVLHPRTPFWDQASASAYEQFDERRLTAWERVKIADIDLPGRCTVMSPGRARKVQRNAGPGNETEEIIDVGALAADVQIVVQLWTPEHLSRWETFCETIREETAKARSETGKESASAPALDVVHPGLNLDGVSSIYVYQVSVPQPGSVRGTMESTILATEYRSWKNKKKNGANLSPVSASKASLALAPEIERASATPADTEAGP